uniref:Cytohesin 1 n=1 Tax=Suricata suricatta TaxID=37032 RepID=A0A673VLM8_SURSU
MGSSPVPGSVLRGSLSLSLSLSLSSPSAPFPSSRALSLSLRICLLLPARDLRACPKGDGVLVTLLADVPPSRPQSPGLWGILLRKVLPGRGDGPPRLRWRKVWECGCRAPSGEQAVNWLTSRKQLELDFRNWVAAVTPVQPAEAHWSGSSGSSSELSWPGRPPGIPGPARPCDAARGAPPPRGARPPHSASARLNLAALRVPLWWGKMVLKTDEEEVPSDLTAEERQELENIRRRKQELLADIQRLKDEIAEVANEIENLGSTEERKNMQRNKQVAMGRKKFNMDPKKGIQFLIENDLLKNTCEDIAQFLYKGEGLNKTAIGDYLGERDEFNIQVLHAFVELHEFTDLNLVQALRQFLWSFRLPGEAQKIDRMMEAFAQRYCQCNSGVFQSTDTCYVLSFAIIMLNTSLHNPNVKDKPTVERFVAMNRGINDGGDLPEELLRNLYESIKNEPFKIPEDDGNDLTHTFFNPDREGWLLKLAGGRVKTWKRRWFILTDNCLYYFEYTTDKEPRGIIPLENLSIREVEDSKKPNCFELYIPDNKDQVIKACKTEADGRVVEGNHTVYRISAPTPEEKEEWIKCIKKQAPFPGRQLSGDRSPHVPSFLNPGGPFTVQVLWAQPGSDSRRGSEARTSDGLWW